MSAHPSGLRVTVADLTHSRPPEWAWTDRLPVGYLSLIIGNEGAGKSTLACWILARLTRGELPGNLHGEPVNVAVIGDEDSFQHVWTPRLHAAGADLARVKILDRPEGGYIELRGDQEKLASAIDLEAIRFCYFDALVDNLGADTNDWHGKHVREALQPVRWIARELNIATVGSLHPNKRGSSFRDLVAGSSAFNAVSRSSLLLAQHPEDDSRRVLLRGKGNLSAAPPAVEFSIQGASFDANGYRFDVPRAASFTTGDISIDELVDQGGEKSAERSKITEAAEIIEELLPRDGQWHAAASIYGAAEAEDIDKRTVQRAKKRLQLEQRRASTFQAQSEWRWPTLTTPHTTLDLDVACVACVASESNITTCNNQHNTHDTDDTHDSANECRECVTSAVYGPMSTL